MYRVIYSLVLFQFLIFPGSLLAADAKHSQLNLRCQIHFTNYHGIKQASSGVNASLKNIKNQEGGAVLATQTKDFEFWVMSHGQQNINGKIFINNFQVAIKDKKSGFFMHALSDSVYTPDKKPSSARISLVDYHPGSLLEKGELFFECKSL